MKRCSRPETISQETFEAKQLGLFELAEEVARDHKVTDLTEVGAIDAETFYEMGGLIRENERYVFGFPVQPSGDNTYEIEVAGGYMYFGERREDVVGWLEAPEDYQPVSPFRGYDTNEDDLWRAADSPRGLASASRSHPAIQPSRSPLDPLGRVQRADRWDCEETKLLPSVDFAHLDPDSSARMRMRAPTAPVLMAASPLSLIAR